jgi:hypothetical protein
MEAELLVADALLLTLVDLVVAEVVIEMDLFGRVTLIHTARCLVTVFRQCKHMVAVEA